MVDLIRRKPVAQAFDILHFCDRAVAVDVEKVLRSAVANAENNNGLRADNLVVAAAYVDEVRRLSASVPAPRVPLLAF